MPQTLTLLNAVQATVERAQITNATLTAFTGQGADHDIDVMIQSWNDLIHQIMRSESVAQESATTTLTLAAVREYAFDGVALPIDVEIIKWPLIDETNGYRIRKYPGGYAKMWRDQLQPGNYTGRPNWAAINKETGKLRTDTTPTSEEVGDTYTMHYDKSINLALITDTFPFSDDVVRALYGPVVGWWKLIKAGKPLNVTNIVGFGTAVELASKRQRRKSYVAR